MSADDNAPEQAREVEVVRAVLAEHLPMVWSDRTVGCQGCAERVEATEPFDRSKYLRLSHGEGEGWSWHQHHVAEQVHAALAPLRAAGRQEAAQEGGRQALLDFAARKHHMAQVWGHDAMWLTTGTNVAGLVAAWASDAADELRGADGAA